MDIFDIFWTFYLNHLSPLWGHFKISYDKTTLYRIRSLTKSDAKKYCVQLTWCETELNILGVNVTKDTDKLNNLNYNSIIDKVSAVLNVWKHHNLPLCGKVLIINSVEASLFTYKMMALPTISDTTVHRFNKIVEEFIWNSRKPKIKIETLQLE